MQNPFEVGDEVTFFHNNKVIEGIVADIGWYRTLIRSFEVGSHALSLSSWKYGWNLVGVLQCHGRAAMAST